MQITEHNQGFTLVEVLVAVSLIAILSSVIYFSVGDAGAQSRDAKRQTDLRLLQSAIELYKNEKGVYPSGCNASSTWSGQKGSGYDCSSGNQYIVNLAPKFIPTLPTDPKLNADETYSGYVYTVNNDGTVYKLMAKNTVESETVTYDHRLKSCDVDSTASNELLCNEVAASPYNNSKPGHCEDSDSQFRTSYAVWGGYANVPLNASNFDLQIHQQTENIVCKQ